MPQIKKLFISSLVLTCTLGIAATSFAKKPYVATANINTTECTVNPMWLSNPSLPTEVDKSEDNGTSSSFCDFYQFSTQTYLYLMSPSATDSTKRNFQVQADYPLLEFNEDGTPANSCDDVIQGPTLRTSLDKSSLGTGQAGGGATIYAQDENIIYYDVRFNRALCNQTASAVEMKNLKQKNFAPGTKEMKFAWKKLSQKEITSNTFVMQTQDITGTSVTLGLVGVHIISATKDHPEFVWATYEHNLNSPDCTPSTATDLENWTFASSACAAALPNSADTGNKCNFNSPKDNETATKGTPTNICRVHPYGTASGDDNAGKNILDITQQNSEMLALFNQSKNPLIQVLKNYFNVGALWVSDIDQSSGGVGVPNERGSLRLANSVAETDYQHVNLVSEEFISNCFGCHHYAGKTQSQSNNITSQNLSHIFRDIKFGQKLSIDVNAEKKISDHSSAKGICYKTCTNLTKYKNKTPIWNGQWTNTNTDSGSVCGCKLD